MSSGRSQSDSMRSHHSTWGAAEAALDQDDNIKVVARIRPLNERELAAGDTIAVNLLEPASSQMQVCRCGLPPTFCNLSFYAAGRAGRRWQQPCERWGKIEED